MLLVKGGEISGRMVMPLTINLSQVGIDSCVTAKANTKPRAVPARPTEKPSKMLLTAARWSYQFETKGRRFSSVKPFSLHKVIARRRKSG